MTPAGRWEIYNPHHDIEDPQYRRRFLLAKPRIQSQGHIVLIHLRRWCHGPPLFRSWQQYHQFYWLWVQQQYAQVTPYAGRTTHEELLLDHANAWQPLLSAAPGGGALLLSLTFSFIFIPHVPLAPLPTLWTLEHGDSDPPHGRKLSTEREIYTMKCFRGGWGGVQIVPTSK